VSAYAIAPIGSALRQCEILADVTEVRIAIDSLSRGGDVEVEERVHPLAIIVTQDCDLSWDFKARTTADPMEARRHANKLLPNVLLCELWLADQLRGAQSIASDLWRRVRSNMDERYHYLQGCDATLDAVGEGFPDLAIDFKRVFTIPPDELYLRISNGGILRRAHLAGPFMQDLSNRFGYYHLRVALPDLEPAPPSEPAALPPAADGEVASNMS
jgi:hypothetical protein